MKKNRRLISCNSLANKELPGAIIGVGDRKRGVHAVPSKEPNVPFLEEAASPSTSKTRAGARKFARHSCGAIVLRLSLGALRTFQVLHHISIGNACTVKE